MARIAILALTALTLTGCTSPQASDDGRVHIVASTNVYGSIAESIGGELVDVTSLIASSAQDPHSFEASAGDQLALSKADLVIENGGGYDPFIDTLLDSASSSPVVISVADSLQLRSGANEHLWYDPNAMVLVSQNIAAQLAELDPAHAEEFESNADTLVGQLETLTAELHALAAQNSGRGVAVTEPVPLYLLQLAGLTNVTPDEFSEAIEEGSDVAPAVLKQALASVADASLLAYNSQTASSETEKVRAAADKAGVPVVEFTETLPDGEDYVSWMTANVAAIAGALE